MSYDALLQTRTSTVLVFPLFLKNDGFSLPTATGLLYNFVPVIFSRFLLLACDGLWKGFEVDEALKYINDVIEV